MKRAILIYSIFLFIPIITNIAYALDMTMFDKINLRLEERKLEFQKETGFQPKSSTIVELNIFSISDICSDYIQKKDLETTFACLDFFRSSLKNDIIVKNLQQLEHHKSQFEILFLKYCNLGSSKGIAYGDLSIDSSRLYCGDSFSKTSSELCELKFGINTYSNGERGDTGGYSCFCKSGSQWNTARTSCIKSEEPIKCGLNSRDNNDGTCSCNSGYVWEKPNDNNNLNCIREVKKTQTEICQEKYGLNTEYFNSKCTCKKGFFVDNEKKSCTNFGLSLEKQNKVKYFFEKLQKNTQNFSKNKKIKFYEKLDTDLQKIYLNNKNQTSRNIIKFLQKLIFDELVIIKDDELSLGSLLDDLVDR